LTSTRPVPFWEIAPANVIGDGGRDHDRARRALLRDPVISHGLSLSVGRFDPFDAEYLEQLAEFLIFTGSPWHSEHLCFSSVDGSTTHELLPMPMTRAAARHTIGRARELKERLLVYRNLVRSDLVEPVESICFVTRALMEQAGLWEDCLAGFTRELPLPRRPSPSAA
jgi:uncharacterized protein (UPF0276 family)